MLKEALPVIWGDDKQAKEGNRAVGHSGLCTKEFRKLTNSKLSRLQGHENYFRLGYLSGSSFSRMP